MLDVHSLLLIHTTSDSSIPIVAVLVLVIAVVETDTVVPLLLAEITLHGLQVELLEGLVI